MINQGRRKRKLAEQERSANKLRRITVKTEPEQVQFTQINSFSYLKIRFSRYSSQLIIFHRLFSFDTHAISRLSCVRILSVIVFHQLKRHSFSMLLLVQVRVARSFKRNKSPKKPILILST